MNCRMTRGIYLRANGEINCYCSTGERISLAKLPLDRRDWDFVTDYYLQGKFSHIRESFSEGRVPFPDQCLKCNYLQPFGDFEADKVGAEVEWIHAESMAVCNLKCPFCVHGIPDSERVYRRQPPHKLPSWLYYKMLDDLQAHGIGIKWIYFSGRGEPTLHPEIWDMVGYTKERFDTNFLVNTNGNVDFDPAIVDCGLDKIKIALDSLEPETYTRYRVGGDVTRLLRLTEQIAAYKQRTGSKTPLIIWQKVLFNYNSSPEELAAYQKTAMECGVDKIRFVYTYSKDYTLSRPEELERIFPDIEVLDCFERDNSGVGHILENRKIAQEQGSMGHLVKAATDILHWLEFGLQNRDDYDSYGAKSLDDMSLYAMREGEDFSEHLQLLQQTFADMAALYGKQGQETAAAIYARYAAGIATE